MGAAPRLPTWTAGKAIDGNTNQSYLSNSCAITDFDRNRNTSIWWTVWLQKKFNVAYIEIYFRSDTYIRSTGFSIYTYIPQNFYPLSDPKHLVYHHDPMSGCPSSVMNITVNNLTQGIAFINTRPQGYTSSCFGDNTMYTGIEICEIRVMGCDIWRYSDECTRSCSSKCSGGCDAFNGSCIHGCSDPNALTIDCIVCTHGQYISHKVCVDCPGHCKDEGQCNKLTGMCNNGCSNQWTGTFCNICSANYYGSHCNTQCGHCKDNDVCNNITGHCPNGCQSHWQGDRCDVCEDGFYNANCTGRCGHCQNKQTCDKESGSCFNGCSSNFQSPLCQECIPYKYGPNCVFDCGHCKDGMTCSTDTGLCTKGCEDGWTGDLCLKVKIDAAESLKQSEEMPTTGTVAIAVLSTLLVISILIIIFMGRKLISNQTNKRHTAIPMSQKQDSSQTYTDLTGTDETHAYSTLGSDVREAPYQVISDASHKMK